MRKYPWSTNYDHLWQYNHNKLQHSLVAKTINSAVLHTYTLLSYVSSNPGAIWLNYYNPLKQNMQTLMLVMCSLYDECTNLTYFLGCCANIIKHVG